MCGGAGMQMDNTYTEALGTGKFLSKWGSYYTLEWDTKFLWLNSSNFLWGKENHERPQKKHFCQNGICGNQMNMKLKKCFLYICF